MSSEFAIKIENVSKVYDIYETPIDRLKQFFLPTLKKIFKITKSNFYKEYRALDGISLEIKKGETVGIIGRNGAGKSTLLQILCGTLTPTTGEVHISGRIAALLELGSGFNPEFTGRDNVYLNASILGLNKAEIDQKLDAILEFADIGEYIDQPVKTYSSGMYVRLAFAVIAHVDADILVIDEALAVGDVFFTQKCMRFLRNFMGHGTIVFVSHDTSAVSSLCNKTVLLTKNKSALIGKTSDVCQIYVKDLYAERDLNVQSTLANEIGKVNYISPKIIVDHDFNREILGEEFGPSAIQVSSFRVDADYFGSGGIKIVDAWFESDADFKVTDLRAGALTHFCLKASFRQDVSYPAFGLMIKDRLGQIIIAEGTDWAFRKKINNGVKGQSITVRFSFRMPTLIQGNYTIDLAAAEGMGDEHIQHHWINEAVVLHVLSSRLVHGINGLEDLRISMRITEGGVN